MNKITDDIIHIAQTQTRSRSLKKNKVADFDESLFKYAFKKYIGKNKLSVNDITSLIESLFNTDNNYNKKIALSVSEYAEIPAAALVNIITKHFKDEKYDSILILDFIRIIEDNKIDSTIPVLEKLFYDSLNENSDIASSIITALYVLEYEGYSNLLSELASIDLNTLLDEKLKYSITGVLVTNLIISSNSEEELVSLFNDLSTLPREQKEYICAEIGKALPRIKGLAGFEKESFINKVYCLSLELLPDLCQNKH